MLHPQSIAATAQWDQDRADLTAPGLDLDALRAEDREHALTLPKTPVAEVRDLDAGGVPARLYRPTGAAAPVLLHAHGGGFVFGDLETHDSHCRSLAARSGWAVVAIDYRLAPEHPYPAAPDDVDTVLRWVRAEGTGLGLDTSRIAIVGDSAGGNLAFTAAYRNPGAFAAAIIVYPCIDPTGSLPSYRREDGGLAPETMDWFWDQYLPAGVDRSTPELNPLRLDLGAMPPCLVITAEHDPLVDEGEALAARLAAAGVEVVGSRYLGMVHGFFGTPELFDAADHADAQVAAYLARVAGGGRVAAVGTG